MQISDEALSEFITIYKAEFSEEIGRKDASEMASRVLTLCELLARKLPNTNSATLVGYSANRRRPSIGFRA